MKKNVFNILSLIIFLVPTLAAGNCSINEVQILYADDEDVGCGMGNDAIEIFGTGLFTSGVTLGDFDLLTCNQYPGTLLAMCPEGDCKSIPGDYKLGIRSGLRWAINKCTYDLTIAKSDAGSGYERIKETFSGLAAGTKFVNTADCSEGKVPIGGGFDINPNAVDGQVIVMESAPYGGGPGVGWRVRADGRNTTQPWEVVINVFCIDKPS